MIDFRLPADNRNGPNCGVTSIAVLAGVPFDRAWRFVSLWKGNNWKGSVTHADMVRALRWFRVRYRSWEKSHTPRPIRQVLDRARSGVVYLIETGSHFALLKDGVLLDQGGHTDAASFRGRIEHVYEVRHAD